MYRFRQWLMRFMQGRYGMDAFGRFLIITYFILAVLGIILRRISLTAFGILYLVQTVLFVFLIFRVFSRNYYARQRENQKYYEIKTKLMPKISLMKQKWANRKTHVYKKCPHCKATIKLPRKKGKHTCTCPRCHVDFKVRILF